MQALAEEIQKELIYLDLEKKRSARKLNYRIKHCKSLLEQCLNGTESKKDVDKFKKKKLTHPINDVDPQETKKNALKIGELKAALTPVKPLPETADKFQVAKDVNLSYDYLTDNMWHETTFDLLKEGDVCRVRHGDRVLPFFGEKKITPIGYPHFNKDDQRVRFFKLFKDSENAANPSDKGDDSPETPS